MFENSYKKIKGNILNTKLVSDQLSEVKNVSVTIWGEKARPGTKKVLKASLCYSIFTLHLWKAFIKYNVKILQILLK